jgi:hypothetical protein
VRKVLVIAVTSDRLAGAFSTNVFIRECPLLPALLQLAHGQHFGDGHCRRHDHTAVVAVGGRLHPRAARQARETAAAADGKQWTVSATAPTTRWVMATTSSATWPRRVRTQQLLPW